MIEQRQHSRINKSTIIRFRLSGNHLGMSCRCENISEGGMRLAVLQRFDLGMNLDLNFKLEDYEESIIAKAKVIWHGIKDNTYYPFVVGLKFFKIDPADSKKIHDYVNRTIYKEKSADTTKINN